MRLFSLFCLAALLTLTACDFTGRRVRGDGNITSRDHKITGFTGVDVSGAIDVIVTGDSVTSVRLETDNNLHEHIEVYEDHGVLHASTRNNINPDPTRGIKLYVSAPALNYFEASGACSIVSKNRITTSKPVEVGLSGASTLKLDIKAPSIRVDGSGASNINLSGETRTLDIDGSGSTEVRAFGLLSETTNIGLSGAGTAEVYASVKLNVNGSGASDVRYKGNATVTSDLSGAGSLKKVE